MPILGNVMKSGFKATLVTDGHLLGASGKVPTAFILRQSFT
ncbi:MAG: phosphogluconate dehydratase [Psychromonas sp.]|jgi:phosphogluconate dehydratase